MMSVTKLALQKTGSLFLNQNIFAVSIGYVLLFLSWVILALLIGAFTEGWLAPWDNYNLNPPSGTWSYAVNDFFQSGLGAWLPVLLVIGGSNLLYWGGARSVDGSNALIWLFALTNFGAIVSIGAILPRIRSFRTQWLEQPRPLIDIGYHLTWPGILSTLFILALLLLLQAFFTARFAVSREKG